MPLWSLRPKSEDFATQRERVIASLREQEYIRTARVEEAMRRVPRELFLPEEMREVAWADSPQSIGEGQTISAPHMVAMMCEALDAGPGMKVLEIGAGSGYHAAVVAACVAPDGHVYTIERFDSLAKAAKANLERAGIENATVFLGDGSLGLEAFAPYDRVYLTCAAPDFPPALVAQLKEGGKILAPIGDRYCTLTLGTKREGRLDKEELGGCVFVPLVGAYGF